MRKNKLSLGTIFLIVTFVITSCQKGIDKPAQQEETSSAANSNSEHGHRKQTKDYSSDVLLRWMDFQLTKYRDNFASVQGTVGVRLMAYTSIAAYESVVPGMPAYQSLTGQLDEMPAMPKTTPGFAYYWPECLNAAMSYITKNLFPPATKSPEQIANIDNFATGLHNEFVQDGASAALLDRSANFGREVARRIVDWSKTDNSGWPNTPFNVSDVFSAQTGKWVRTGTLETVVGPYWGYTRKLVSASLDGVNRINPFSYSGIPGSDFYNMVKQISDNTYNPNGYTLEERKLINTYFRDRPGYGSGHYMSILKLVLAKAKPTLDQSALIFAEAGISMQDAGIGCWQIKYDQQNNYVVRPISYIRTVIRNEPAWNTIMPTPNHPEYPSGHSTLAGAMSEILTHHFGSGFSFTDNTYEGFAVPEYPGGMGSRYYTSFDNMAQEIGDSRVYGQIHYPQSCLDGKALGKKVAQNVLSTVRFLKE